MSIDFGGVWSLGVWSLALTLSAMVVLALVIEWRRKPKPIKPEPEEALDAR
jgi:hypothetical protein